MSAAESSFWKRNTHPAEREPKNTSNKTRKPRADRQFLSLARWVRKRPVDRACAFGLGSGSTLLRFRKPLECRCPAYRLNLPLSISFSSAPPPGPEVDANLSAAMHRSLSGTPACVPGFGFDDVLISMHLPHLAELPAPPLKRRQRVHQFIKSFPRNHLRWKNIES